MGIKLNVLMKQRIFLESCVKCNVCPPEISSLARRIERQMGSGVLNRSVNNEKKILRQRIANISREVRIQRNM
jgi:hypothetical protein